MTDDNRPRGPWDRPPSQDAAQAKVIKLDTARGQNRAPPQPFPGLLDDRGQHPFWVVVSVLLLGGLIWYMWGAWQIAVAVIVGVFVHEYGHVLAMNALGMGPARLYIVPFFGGLAKSARLPSSEWHGVLVSLAGPAFGLLAAIPFFALGYVLGEPVWYVGAFAIAALNLLNLLPAPPLDGSKAIGPVLAMIHPMVERVAMLLVGGLAVLWGVTAGQYFLAIFLGIALIGYLKAGAWRPEGRRLTGGEAFMSVGLFLGTALLCAGVGFAAIVLQTSADSLAAGVSTAGHIAGLDRA